MVVLLVVHLPRRHPTVHLDVGPVPSARAAAAAAAAGEHLGSSVHVAASTLNVRSSFGHDAFLVLRASQVLVPLRPDGAVDVAGLCAVVASSGVAAQQEDQQAIEVDLVYGKPSTYAAQTQAAVRQLDGDVRGMRREVARLNDMLKAFQKQHLRQLEVIRTVLTQTGGGSGAGAGVDDSALQRAMRKAHFDGALSSGAPSTEPAPSTNGLRQGPERVPSPSSALFTPIGYLESVFLTKNGTPRQGFACAAARARLTVSLGANSEHYLDGLKDYSHVWLLFLFHDNGGGIGLRAKIQPPMRDGDKTGLFATRSPHRPNPIGLSLCRLDAIDGATLMLSAVDLIHGTPVLDIKPYLPRWDSVVPESDCRVAQWVVQPRVQPLAVHWDSSALQQAADLDQTGHFRLLQSSNELVSAINDVLQSDPRSIGRRQKQQQQKLEDERYRFGLDSVDVVCKFDDDQRTVTVTAIELLDTNAPIHVARGIASRKEADDL